MKGQNPFQTTDGQGFFEPDGAPDWKTDRDHMLQPLRNLSAVEVLNDPGQDGLRTAMIPVRIDVQLDPRDPHLDLVHQLVDLVWQIGQTAGVVFSLPVTARLAAVWRHAETVASAARCCRPDG